MTTDTDQSSDRLHSRKQQSGTIVSTKMQKTVVVKVDHTIRHPRYNKIVLRSKKYYAHNEDASLKDGDKVVIMETRPLSKMKRWRVVGKVEQASL